MASCAFRSPLCLLLLPGRAPVGSCLARFRSTAASPKQKEAPAQEDADRAHGHHRLRDIPRVHPAPAQGSPDIPDFSNYQEAYRNKTSAEVVRSLVVFRLCSYDILVNRQKELINLSRIVLGKWLFRQLMKMTFYGQFVAGEDQEDIKPLIRHNRSFGVGSILDYSVEEDLTQEEAEKKEMDFFFSVTILLIKNPRNGKFSWSLEPSV